MKKLPDPPKQPAKSAPIHEWSQYLGDLKDWLLLWQRLDEYMAGKKKRRGSSEK